MIKGRQIFELSQSWSATIVLAILIGIVLLQHWETVRHGTTQGRSRHILRSGDHLSPAHVEALDGSSAIISWNGKVPTVVYVFSSTCAWCEKNLAAARALIGGVSHRYRVVGISPTRAGLKEYLKSARLTLPVYVSRASIDSVDMAMTPETFVVSPDGTVTNVWLGAYGPNVARDIEQVLGVELPAVQLE